MENESCLSLLFENKRWESESFLHEIMITFGCTIDEAKVIAGVSPERVNKKG